MRKILLYSLLSFALFSGCKKDEILVDGERPEERVTEALTKYNDLLTGSAFGWKAYLYPSGGGGYSFYLNFTKSNRVTMFADLDYGPAQTSMESSYRMKAMQAPTLSFDTYNYMHILADPNPSVFGGVAGYGVYSDFEFAVDKQVGDTLKLNGKFLDSKLILVKATQAEQTSYNSKGLFNSVSNTVNYTSANPNLYVFLGDATKIQTSIDVYNKVFSLTYESNGEVITTSTGFAFTLTGIILQDPLYYKGKKISELTWDSVKGVYYTIVDGARVEIVISPTPILPLHLLIGINYTTITAPNGTTYPGWSSDFQARRAAAAAAMLAGPYALRLDKMAFKFNTIQKTMVLTVDIYQGATRFIGDFPYTFVKSAAGVYKFTAGTPTGNAALIIANMAPLTTQRLNVDQFTLDYFTHPSTGATLGQFKSVENPGFTFTGALQ
ncbi:DUF4302 domain-containing protein [Pedobacter fastidiosus]|uniref:DUF4302 domain-containing protein n=1 Tax=Pedobacter fastidiosus TaxID=2765361 RepID=A0ABR7KMW0_9SPHI|nr:DUF4302 domain-containing protein [Pedobacter fastidiosus]MBC6109073.1 DUF4302 domain-containing protein [Pedobacter fastidiosus]